MKNVIVLYGVEVNLILEKQKELMGKILPNKDDSLISVYDMKETLVETVIEDAMMPSLLGDKKIIILEDCYFLTGESVKSSVEINTDLLLEYIKNPNENTYLFLKVKAEKLDERKKIVKELKKDSTIYEAKKLEEKDLVEQLYKEVIDNGYKIDKQVVKKLIRRGGSIYSNLTKELEKLYMYKLDTKEILESDVEELVTKKLEDNIFDLIDCTVKKDYKKMFDIYEDLIFQGEEIIKIIVLLANQYRLLYQAKILSQKGYSGTDIAKKIGVHPYPVKLALEKVNHFSEEELLDKLLKLVDMDEQIKMGLVDKNLAMELFFVNA